MLKGTFISTVVLALSSATSVAADGTFLIGASTFNGTIPKSFNVSFTADGTVQDGVSTNATAAICNVGVLYPFNALPAEFAIPFTCLVDGFVAEFYYGKDWPTKAPQAGIIFGIGSQLGGYGLADHPGTSSFVSNNMQNYTSYPKDNVTISASSPYRLHPSLYSSLRPGSVASGDVQTSKRTKRNSRAARWIGKKTA